MQNIQFPFNQKEHIFDFKVKVNFQNGNVSLTAPQIVTPPAVFNNQVGFNRNVQQSNRGLNFNVQNNMNGNIITTAMQTKQNVYPNSYLQPIPHNTPPQLPTIHPPTNFPTRVQQIQLVNSSYTSLKECEYNTQPLTINNNNTNNYSMQMIECVLCQKAFNPNELQRHLELHRNRCGGGISSGYNNNNRNVMNNISTQKGNVSNYAMTQISVNGVNDDDSSMLSVHHDPNKSYLSQNNSLNNHRSIPRIMNRKYSSFVTSNANVNGVQGRNEHERNNSNVQNGINPQELQQQNGSSFQLLGRIQNPILAIKAAQQQQGSLSQSYSSHPNQSLLDYSNSDGQQSIARFNTPMVSDQIDQSPQFHNSQINNSSFGNVPGNNVIGPSFFQNSSQQTVGNVHNQNGPEFKGINRLAMNEIDGLMQAQNNMITNPIQMMQNNLSFQSSQSNNSSYKFPIIQQQQSMHINPIHHQQHSPSHPPNSYSNSTNPIQSSHSSLFCSNGSLMNGNVLPLSNSNPIYQNFENIQSRYINHYQPGANARQLYGSYRDVNGFQEQQCRNNKMYMRNNQQTPFSESDISSISYESHADLSQCSDWTGLKPLSQQKLQQGYNSADNSIIRNMQQHTSSSRHLQQQHNNFLISRRPSNNNTNAHQHQQPGGEQAFFRKKKQYMITSAASYYDKKFKDEVSSSSSDDEQDNVYKLGRLSYAQRLKQKRMSDNIKSMVMSQAKSVSKLKQSSSCLNRSNNNNHNSNLSKCSQDSSTSKTKLPVNYLARQQFISTSSTSKSTHKTSAPN